MLGLFSGELIFGGAYYWREFCVLNWVGVDKENSIKHKDGNLKQLKIANNNSPWACFREGLFSKGLIIGNLRYFISIVNNNMMLLGNFGSKSKKLPESRFVGVDSVAFLYNFTSIKRYQLKATILLAFKMFYLQ